MSGERERERYGSKSSQNSPYLNTPALPIQVRLDMVNQKEKCENTARSHSLEQIIPSQVVDHLLQVSAIPIFE